MCSTNVLTRVRIEHRGLTAKWAIVLLVILHHNQAPNAEDVLTAELDRPPLDLHTHRAGVIIDLRDVAQNLSVNFGADGFGEMF